MVLGTVGVIGAGINGLCIAWQLALRGWQVTVFERGRCLEQASSASNKLLHGGLRYLEQGHLNLVAESLGERGRWLRDAPQHCRWLPLLLPIQRVAQRPAWQWQVGLGLYDGLAFGRVPSFARWLSPRQVQMLQPDLACEDILGAWQFWDGQMDEQALGLWVRDQAVRSGVVVHEKVPVDRLSPDGSLWCAGTQLRFDWLVNAAGPWAQQLLEQSGINTDVRLDLVRGSHLMVPVPAEAALPSHGLFVEEPGCNRIAFLLPYQGELLVGTTEEVQSLDVHTTTSATERAFLQELVARRLPSWADTARDHGRTFAGLRPIVYSSSDVSPASRDAVIRRHGQLISVFGGKWTTARALAERLVQHATFNGLP